MLNLLFRLNEQAEWKKIVERNLPSVPSLYRGIIEITDKPKDTFMHMKSWTKGVVFINGHNLGRYWNIGPQETLYLPSPLLRKGQNEVHYCRYLLVSQDYYVSLEYLWLRLFLYLR